MKINIVSVGNSRGLRLPKTVLDQCRFGDVAELTIENGRIVLTPVATPRAGWREAFLADPQGVLTDEDREWLDAPLTMDED